MANYEKTFGLLLSEFSDEDIELNGGQDIIGDFRYFTVKGCIDLYQSNLTHKWDIFVRDEGVELTDGQKALLYRIGTVTNGKGKKVQL